MKLPRSFAPNRRGSALIMVLILSAVTMLVLVSTLQWATTNNTLSQRNNEYFRTVAVAESATEKVIARITSDYQLNGDTLVNANLNAVGGYRDTVPTSTENALFGNYAFTDGQGNAGKTYVQTLAASQFRVLTAQYRDLYGYATPYRVISNARDTKSRFNLTAAVWQDVETATIPLFQFAIFYNIDLEINPGPVMTVTGPVHGNQTIYLQPQATLTFQGDVTSAADIINNKKPGDPIVRSGGTIVFQGTNNDITVSTLNLPIGTNNSSAAVRGVVEVPPSGEAANSPMGQQRFYNKADLIVRVTNGGTSVTSGRIDNFGTTIPSSQWDYFLNVGTTFYNKRENKTVNAVELDVAKLRTWNGSNDLLSPILTGSGGDVTIVYVVDQRTLGASYQPGVRVINGQLLPPKGLTVVTPAPLYVKGHYNAPTAALGTANTSGTKPAALIGDAITVLSKDWDDSDGGSSLGSRPASSTTVNAAFLAGIVQTTSGEYSGGVENFPRFLEDWSGDTFTYNGSMVVMYESAIATGLWQGTGSSIGIYNPPNRNWAFDKNFRDPTKLPPGTPCVRALVRGHWAMVKPNSIDVVSPNDLAP